jgi:transketolase
MTVSAPSASPALTPHPKHRPMANAIRALSMDAVEKAQSGHPGMPMGMADVATVLYTQFLKYDPQHPHWPDRDRFVLSAGHGSMLLYSLLYLTGYADCTLEDIKNFRQLGSKTAGHPEYGELAGIETTTGPLGQGIATSVGMALGEATMAAQFTDRLVDHYTYVIAGDGCLMEGISQEAISLAGHLGLDKLIVYWDDNGISIDGPISLSSSEDMIQRFEAAGWHVQAIDGHDPEAIAEATLEAQNSHKPSMIACKTTIAYGAPTKAGSEKSHGAPLGEEEIAGTREALDWEHAPFEIPDDILQAWREAGGQGTHAFADWEKRLKGSDKDTQALFERLMRGELPDGWMHAVQETKKILCENPVKEATRKSSQNALEVLTKAVPEMLGGSADLTGSNNTRTKALEPITRDDYSGRYLYYGIREHGMAACMNGLALHGGVIPYGGTFMVFTDYCRPAIRLSALMKQRVIYVMTHDSIGLGEDGPTHQPVEHLASLRAMPNLHTFRPCDAVETLEAWQWAVESKDAPSILSLTRQGVPQLRHDYTEENLSARGGYIISPAEEKATVSLMASGSEVHLATDAQTLLAKSGIHADVISMPCTTLFDAQDAEYQANVLPDATLKVAIEAASGFGWERYIGRDGIFIGMNSFGASAPAPDLYKHFGITTEAIVKAVKSRLG